MADKKVDRYRPKRSLPPTQSGKAAPSGPGTIGTAEDEREGRRTALLDKFRKREERWRSQQALHDREAGEATRPQPGADAGRDESPDGKGSGEGGAK